MLKIRPLILSVLCILSTYCVIAQQKPNILIILTDDQGYHDVSYYGTPDIHTPNIDALIGDGMRFDRFYANCPVCSPTRAALLAGTYPDQVGVPGVIRTHEQDNWGYLDPDTKLLPDHLRSAGYHTALVGKWHLGLQSPNTPIERGFDHFHGWLGDMMDDYWKKRRHEINYMRQEQNTIDPEGHATDLFTQWAVDYIGDRSEEDDPFFLYLAYNAPHFPVQPPKDWLEKVRQREPQVSEKRAKLIAFIEHLDDGIGQVIDKLKATSQYDNTIIFFTSDNGGLLRDEANNGPLRDGKQSMYEGGLRVPTGVTWPAGGVAPGSSNGQALATMDIFATCLDLVSIPRPQGLPSRSFLPTLLGETQDFTGRPLYFVRREGGDRYGGLTIQAVLQDDWKLLQNSPFAEQELYHLESDPGEKKNLIHVAKERYQDLNSLLRKFVQAGGEVRWQKSK